MVAGRIENIKELCIQERHKHDKEEMGDVNDDGWHNIIREMILALADKRKWFWQNLQYGQK